MKSLLQAVFIVLYLMIMPLNLYANICVHDSSEVFISPVKHPILLSGTFGELRSTHFHTGIDIKSSNGRIGDKLYSIGSGYVSRIKVQAGGYGKVLYIDHPNGYTSVYAHLHQFTDEVEEFLKLQQYKSEHFEVDIYLSPKDFKIKQGEYIGKMGMTGRASGPHLHFEIRESNTEIPINPLSCGINIADTRKPNIYSIQAYAKNTLGLTERIPFNCLNRPGASSTIQAGDSLICQVEEVAFGAEVYDLMNGASNRNGIYQLDLLVDGQRKFRVRFDQISFTEYRKILGYLDYDYRKRKRKTVSRFHKLPGLELALYKEFQNDGFITLNTQFKEITLKVYDFDHNVNTSRFWIKYDEAAPEVESSTHVYHAHLSHKTEHFVNTDWLKIYIPKGCLAEDLYLLYSQTEEESDGKLKRVFNLHHENQILLEEIEIAIKSKECSSAYRDKLSIVYCDTSGTEHSFGGTTQGEFVKARINTFGPLYVVADTIPPSIKQVHWSKTWTNMNKVSFKIWDNLETRANASDLKYKAYLDYQWILFQHDKKNNVITYYFDEKLTRGEHDFKLMVEDDRGNHTVFSSRISY